MSTPKRFYWMKLKDSFMSSDTVDYFMSMPDGANYVVLYQLLCLKTINTDGRLSRTIGEIIIPYDIEKIRRDLKWFSTDTIRVALTLYKSVGLVYEEIDGTLVIADHANLVGSETDAAARMRNSRANRNQSLPSGEKDNEHVANNVTPEKEIDIRDRDRYRVRDKESRDYIASTEDLLKEEKGTICTEPPKGDSVLELMLNDKTAFHVYQSDVSEWSELYPAVDVMQEIRSMKGWLNANPTRRKTRSGIKRFINAWLAKAQNRGGTSGLSEQRCGSPASFSDIAKSIAEEAQNDS